MITTRKKQSFGIAAVELGAPVSTVPSIPVNLNEWEHAVLNGYFLQRRRKRDRFKYKPTDDVGSEKSVFVSDLL